MFTQILVFDEKCSKYFNLIKSLNSILFISYSLQICEGNDFNMDLHNIAVIIK